MYEDFYNLQAKPFRLSPDPEFFFASRGHKRALAYLRYGLNQDEGFVVITGAPGTGKTTLAQILLREMDPSKVVVAHITTTQLEADDILRMVTASFGLPYESMDKTGLLKTLEAFLLEQSRAQKRALLVVDEAQNLPSRSIEELRMLSNMQVGNNALLQTILLGQGQFRQMLEHPDHEQFRQRVIANYHLSELAEDECQRYIESRLEHVGWQNDPHYTPAAYEGIYQYAQGIPRRINMLCDRLMLFSFLEGRHEIDDVVLQEVTKELHQEISGKPIDATELSHNQESMYSDLHGSPKSKKRATKADTKSSTSNSDVLKELEAKDKHSAYSINQGDAEGDPQNSDLEKVIPDDGYDELVAQYQPNELDGDNKNRDAGQLGASKASSQPTNKDRFHVISGGRRNLQANSEGMSSNMDSNAVNEQSSHSDGSGKSEDEVVLRKILRLVLAYHRSPRSFPGLDDPSQPLPKGITQILSLAVSDDEVLSNLRQIAVMGISPTMLRAAVRFFVRRVMFLPGGDDYRVLGLSSSATQDQIEEHFGLLMRIMRHEKQAHGDSGIARIREAYERLAEVEAPEIETESSDQQIKNDYITDIGDEYDLDLDLSPNGEGVSSSEISRERRTEQFSDLITGDQFSDMISGDRRTAQASRNIVLITGAVVVGFVLYLTQITNPDLGEKNINPAISEQETVSAGGGEEMRASTEVAAIEKTAINQGINNPVVNSETRDVDENEETRRQRIMEELRAQAEAEEKAKREAEAIERAKRDAEIRRATLAAQKAQEAQAAAESKARREAEERARIEAAAKARREAEERARIEAAAKARREAEERARIQAAIEAQVKAEEEAKARTEAEERARAEAEEKATQIAATVDAEESISQTQTESIASIEELTQVLENFAYAYGSGDINQFMGLFSPDAKTNDQDSLDGIRGDYAPLFANTEYRKIEFNGMQWQREAGISRGEGNYVVKVRANGKSNNDVYRGKLWFTIERAGGKLMISYFAFK